MFATSLSVCGSFFSCLLSQLCCGPTLFLFCHFLFFPDLDFSLYFQFSLFLQLLSHHCWPAISHCPGLYFPQLPHFSRSCFLFCLYFPQLFLSTTGLACISY